MGSVDLTELSNHVFEFVVLVGTIFEFRPQDMFGGVGVGCDFVRQSS